MAKRQLAIVGLGRLGRACISALAADSQTDLAAVVRRPESVGAAKEALPGHPPVLRHPGELRGVDGALVCVPPAHATECASELLQHGIPTVDCAILHGEGLVAHRQALHAVAQHRHTRSVTGAGWDPGALSLLRGLFTLLTPKGTTAARTHAGAELHRSLSESAVPGIKAAAWTERRDVNGKLLRYVYIEPVPGADMERVSAAIRAEPLFVGEETQVFRVDSVDALLQEGLGVTIERRGASGPTRHQLLMLEARVDVYTMAAQMMLAAAHALPWLAPGAHTIFEVPLGHLWGPLGERISRELI